MKQRIALGLLIVVIGAIGYFSVRIYQDVTAEQAVKKRVQTLPSFSLRTLDGTVVQRADLPKKRPSVFVFLTPSCPYCKSETESIRSHDALRDTAKILMVSARPKPDLEAFADSFGIRDLTQVRVFHDSAGTVLETFGVDQVPHTFIYDGDGSLVEQFSGEVGAAALYSSLQRMYASGADPDSQ